MSIQHAIWKVGDKPTPTKESGSRVFLSAHIIAQEIVDDLEAALEQFRLIANDLGGETPTESV